LLSQLGHILQVTDGMVYPQRIKNPPYRPIIQNQVTGDKTSDIYNSQTAGREGEINVSNQSGTVNVVNEFSAERNVDDVAGACYKQAKVTEIVENSSVSTTRPLTALWM
jgi:hypothetical protein